jgi:hypothetical protein
MNDLDQLCKAPSAGFTLDQIMSRCNSYSMVWDLSVPKIGMIVGGALLIGVLVLIDRIRQEKAGAAVTIFNTLEGLVYGALAVWAGSSAGLMVALLLPPVVLGLMLVVFAALALLIMILALINGTGSGSKTALGVICLLGLAGSLVTAAAFAFRVPTSGRAGDAYETYLWAMAILFATTALVGAWVVSIFRGYHWAVGWLLVPLNASWGLLGNLLGLMNHFACLFFYSDSGKVQDTRLL